MRAEIITHDGVAIDLSAIEQLHILSEFLGAADRPLIAVHRVPVCEGLRPVTIKHEKVGMSAIRKRCFRLRSDRLSGGRKPRPGSLPGVVISVKLLRSERPVVRR